MKHGKLYLNILHIFNDGYYASIILLLPFLANTLHLNLSEAGFLGALPGILAIFISLPSGTLSIRFGGLKILITAVLIYAASFLLLPWASSFFTTALIFTLAGCAFGLFHPIAFALVAKLSDKTNRGRIMGTFTALGDSGKVAISAGVTFLAAAIGWQNTSLLYGGAAFLFFSFLIFSHFKTNHLAMEHKKPEHVAWVKLLSNKRFILSCLTGLLDYMSSYPLFIFIPFLFLHKGISPALLGSFVGAYLIGNLAGKATLGALTDKHGYTKVFIFAEALTASFILLLTFSGGLVPIIGISIILGALTKGT
ncbi:MAG: MFS transporter, partial [Candidatus Levyibacteriota bacterium]